MTQPSDALFPPGGNVPGLKLDGQPSWEQVPLGRAKILPWTFGGLWVGRQQKNVLTATGKESQVQLVSALFLVVTVKLSQLDCKHQNKKQAGWRTHAKASLQAARSCSLKHVSSFQLPTHKSLPQSKCTSAHGSPFNTHKLAKQHCKPQTLRDDLLCPPNFSLFCN